jgi:hypothetical protein
VLRDPARVVPRCRVWLLAMRNGFAYAGIPGVELAVSHGKIAARGRRSGISHQDRFAEENRVGRARLKVSDVSLGSARNVANRPWLPRYLGCLCARDRRAVPPIPGRAGHGNVGLPRKVKRGIPAQPPDPGMGGCQTRPGGRGGALCHIRGQRHAVNSRYFGTSPARPVCFRQAWILRHRQKPRYGHAGHLASDRPLWPERAAQCRRACPHCRAPAGRPALQG